MKRIYPMLCLLLWLLPLDLLGHGILDKLSSAIPKENSQGKLAISISPYGRSIFVFWTELESTDSYEKGRLPDVFYYYRVVDESGRILCNKKELTFWRQPIDMSYDLSSSTLLWLDTTQLLLIVQKMINPYSEPPGYALERLILDSSGTIVSGPDASIIGMLRPQIVKDSRGRVYVVDFENDRVDIAQVYPYFSDKKTTPVENLQGFRKRFTYGVFSLFGSVATMTSEDRLIIWNRLGWGKEEIAGWSRRPNELFHFLADVNGNIVSDAVQFDVTKDAFRKIPGIHLGGNYGQGIYGNRLLKGASEDLDVTHLPSGDIILSVTGLDEKDELCVYQVKFSAEGKLIKPDLMEVVKPQEYPENRMLPISKVREAVVGLGEIPGRNKVLVRRELVLFGFDEEGNFYEEREVWKEGEEK